MGKWYISEGMVGQVYIKYDCVLIISKFYFMAVDKWLK